MRKEIIWTSALLGALLGTLSAVPAHAEQLWGITSNNVLIRFDAAAPTVVLSQKSVTGLGSSEFLRAIDVRPESGDIFSVSSTGQVYKIDAGSGAATALGSPLATSIGSASVGLDFNPVVDRLRLVTENDDNVRIDPSSGAIVGTDTNLSYDSGDVNTGGNPAIGCIAYTNNFSGATSTTLFGVDTTLDALVRIGGIAGIPSPNTGVAFTEQPVGVDTTADCGADISPNTGLFYASMTSSATNFSSLYVIDLGTGKRLARIGTIGSGALIRDIAVAQNETNGPAVTITRPSAASVTTRASRLTIRGETSDDNEITSIRYRIVRGGRAGSFRTVSGTSSFSFNVELEKGTQTIQVVSTDIFGNQGLDSVDVRRR